MAAIGVSCGSPLDRERGIVQAPPNFPTWMDVPIRQLLSDAFHAVPAGERRQRGRGGGTSFRRRAGCGPYGVSDLGHGLGAGIIAAGSLYLGANGDAGEIGHVRLSPTGPVGYHKAGSVEGWSSGGGIAQLAARLLAQAERRGEGSVLTQGATARDVGRAAAAGDAVALRILRARGNGWARRWPC